MAFVYSCCFWFSLRLGGIFIGLFSMVQGVVTLIICCLANNHIQQIKDDISYWINNLNVIYAEDYLINIIEEPEKYVRLGLSLSSMYIVICLMFICGAYLCNNILMVCYILLELLRLILLSILTVTGLLLLKLNTMDIGILIGASVASGFLLLGMFYLWICAANLPILINEMERDEQAATIVKLQELLEKNNLKTNNSRLPNNLRIDYHTPMEGLFVISKIVPPSDKKVIPSRISVVY